MAAAPLKACPFCGGEVQPRHALWPSDGDVDAIIHSSPFAYCGVGDFTVHTADGGKTVAEAWNHRLSAAPPPDKALIKSAFERYHTLHFYEFFAEESLFRKKLANHAFEAGFRAALAQLPQPDRGEG